LAENGIFLCPDPAVVNLSREAIPKQTYDVILIDNKEIARAERVWEYADGTEKKQSEAYLNGYQMLLYSREYHKTGCRVRQYFYDEDDRLINFGNLAKLVDLDKPEVSIDTGNIVHLTYSHKMTEIKQLARLMNAANFEHAVQYDSHWEVGYEESLSQMLTIGTDDGIKHITYIFLTFGEDSGKCVFSRITTDNSNSKKTETLCLAFENPEIYEQIEKAVEQVLTIASVEES